MFVKYLPFLWGVRRWRGSYELIGYASPAEALSQCVGGSYELGVCAF